MQQILLTAFALTFFAQTPSLDSLSPKERREAIESIAILGNREAVPALVEAYRKEPRNDLRTSIVAALGQIRDRSAIPGLSEALLGDFERDVRLQGIDSLLRLYIPVADDEGFWSFIGRVRNVFSGKERPIVGVKPTSIRLQKRYSSSRSSGISIPKYGSRLPTPWVSLRAVDQLPGLIEQLEGPRNREDRDVRGRSSGLWV